MSGLGGVVVLIGTTGLFTLDLRGTPLHLVGRSSPARRAGTAAVLIIQSGTGFLVGLFLHGARLALPLTAALHGRRRSVLTTVASSSLGGRGGRSRRRSTRSNASGGNALVRTGMELLVGIT
jgi:hypothetical protein